MDIRLDSKTTRIILLTTLCWLYFSFVSSDYTDLVYRGCADQKFPDPNQAYTQNLKTLLDTLVSQSSSTNFSKTTIGQGGEAAIMGLYQCRGDLTANDCRACVARFPKLATKYCGENTIAVRVQLVGCTVRYEVVGFPVSSSTQMLYKVCKGGSVGSGSGGVFEGERESGFEAVEAAVSGGGGGFNAVREGGVYVMGQCEGDLSGSECGECVKSGFEKVKNECGDSMSAQVYLNQCYVSYSYYPNGVADDKTTSSSSSNKKGTAKTVAIVVGVTAAVGFLVAILLCMKSIFKKKPKKYQQYG